MNRNRKVAPELSPEQTEILLRKIGARLDQLFQERDIKLSDFAYEIGISRSQLDGYRKGKGMLLTNFLKLLHGLEVPPAEFFKGL